MLRKISHIGNSQGVSIPKDMLERLHLSVGSEVEVNLVEKEGRIIIEPRTARRSFKSIGRKFASELDDFIRRYKPALSSLARK